MLDYIVMFVINGRLKKKKQQITLKLGISEVRDLLRYINTFGTIDNKGFWKGEKTIEFQSMCIDAGPGRFCFNMRPKAKPRKRRNAVSFR
jgi:hypothetical protein